MSEEHAERLQPIVDEMMRRVREAKTADCDVSQGVREKPGHGPYVEHEYDGTATYTIRINGGVGREFGGKKELGK